MAFHLQSAKAIKLRFNLVSDSSHDTKPWELAFLEKMVSFESDTFIIKYSYSDSLTTELKNVYWGKEIRPALKSATKYELKMKSPSTTQFKNRLEHTS
jgi:hypothetical protein